VKCNFSVALNLRGKCKKEAAKNRENVSFLLAYPKFKFGLAMVILPELPFPLPGRGYGLALLLHNHHVELTLE
jgi:hypothetical protein